MLAICAMVTLFSALTCPACVDDALDPTPTEQVLDSSVLRATCETPVGGPIPLTIDTAYEAYPGYEDELASLDLDALPDTLELASLGSIQNALIAYMLEIPPEELPETITREEVAANHPMGTAVLGAFAEAARLDQEGIDLPFLRRGLHRFYQCDRAFPLTLEGFKATILDYDTIESYDIFSIPKNDIRRLRQDGAAGVYIAETIVDDAIRETEILLADHRDDGALDFVVYGADGNLMDRSEFVTASEDNIGGAAPYACIACHFEAQTFHITVIFPEMDPVVPRRSP